MATGREIWHRTVEPRVEELGDELRALGVDLQPVEPGAAGVFGRGAVVGAIVPAISLAVSSRGVTVSFIPVGVKDFSPGSMADGQPAAEVVRVRDRTGVAELGDDAPARPLRARPRPLSASPRSGRRCRCQVRR
jgi:hypothetical protein